MFATVDKMENRMIRVLLDAPAGQRQAVVPGAAYGLADYTVRTLPAPSQRRLQHIGRVVLDACRDRGATAVRVEVWTLQFDSATAVVTPRKLVELTVRG